MYKNVDFMGEEHNMAPIMGSCIAARCMHTVRHLQTPFTPGDNNAGPPAMHINAKSSMLYVQGHGVNQ